MRKFNLKEAKAGKPVCTRRGRSARIICFDAKGKYCIIALVDVRDHEYPVSVNCEGKYLDSNEEDDDDLFMAD